MGQGDNNDLNRVSNNEESKGGAEWCEVRLSGKLPERRSNHSSFIVNDYFYIHGGRDIKEGPMGNMWRLNIHGVTELAEDPEYGVAWESITARGTVPGKISHHKPAVFGNSVVCYGGITDACEVYCFDSDKCSWSTMKQSGDVPAPRDDHSLAQYDGEKFVIFGGFVAGSRVNEVFVGTKSGNEISWKQCAEDCGDGPCIRNSHSAVCHGGKMYVFGGQDDDNNKLCDLWELDLASEKWCEIKAAGYEPHPRSGHSANVHNGKMYVFGGILELTKELDDLFCFDFTSRKFEMIGEGTTGHMQETNLMGAGAGGMGAT
jgi:hypothetical protein